MAARPVAALVAAALLCFSAVALAAPTRTGDAAESWVGDFETGDLSQWTGVQRAQPDRVSVVTDPVRDGRYAVRFKVMPGDYPVGPSGERAELYEDTPDRPGTEWYYAWSTLFPSDRVIWKR